ncbi:MAG: DUF5615 family PIN-like protein [Armatimonadetes bacterium]|nr:DUF5615 family PIN-like protein [Armatimonadota bacterium]
MGLYLLIDEDTQARPLVRLLRAAGHDVLTVAEAGLSEQPDESVLGFARSHGKAVLTHNCGDFEVLHQRDCRHPGILAVYRGHDSSKNMSHHAIVRAISNLEASGVELADQFIPLNLWSY